MSRNFLPGISNSNREDRVKIRGHFAQNNAQEEEIRRIQKKAEEDSIEAEKKANFKAAMLFLESQNPKSKKGAKNFHGIPQAASTFSISDKELRDALTEMHSKSSAVTLAAAAETPEVDEGVESTKALFVQFVDKVVCREIKFVDEGYRQFGASVPQGTEIVSGKSFRRAVERRRLIPPGPYFAKMGRGDMIPDELITALAERQKKEDLAGNSCERVNDASRNKIQFPGYDPTEIHGTFSNKVHETLEIVSPDQHARRFSASSLRRIEKKAEFEATKTSTDKGQQNSRRHQAMNDPYNYFALVIMLMVIYSKGVIDPRLSFNTDKSSSLLNDDTNMVILSAFGVKHELDKLNRNVTTCLSS